jgi:DNA invertase Pin-like site-specific DNA recombinase
MSMERVALYARVSTKGMGQDPEGQLISLREYAQRRGWTVVGEYVDNGFSGAKANTRPALQQLWKDGRQRKFDVVACGSWTDSGAACAIS